MSVWDCQLVELPRIIDPRGSLSFVEGSRHIPYDIRRVYYLYDVPSAVERGGHAHRNLVQLLIAVAGSFDVVLDDGDSEHTITLNRPYIGLLIPRMIWRVINNFSSGAVCLVLASLPYDEADYYRDYTEFFTAVKLEHEKAMS